MRIKEGFTLRELRGENIVIGEGIDLVNFNKLLHLNASAAYLWENVAGRDFTVEDLAGLLLDRYKVSEGVALADAGRLVGLLQENGVLEE